MNALDEQRHVAVHEAGHCAVRDYFGIEIAETWINEGRGNTRFRVPDKGDIGLFQDIAGSLAGKIAEDRLRGFKAEWESDCKADYARAFDCALRLNAKDEVGAKLLLQWMQHRVELLVGKLWPRIHKLAFALLENGRIAGPELHEIMHESKG
jgi:hypothetical protein